MSLNIDRTPMDHEMQKLWNHCIEFIKKQHITCPETVHQSDHVIVNAYGHLEGMCNIVGYVNSEEED